MSEDETLGGRLPLAAATSLNQEQRRLFDIVTVHHVPWADRSGFRVTTTDGRLIGPFNSFLLHPEISLKFLEFADAESAHTRLPERVREALILTVGGVWSAKYELYTHTVLAGIAGLSEDTIDALTRGGLPNDLTDDESVAVRVAQQLLAHHGIDDELYRVAENAFGRKGLFDIAAVIGKYQAVSTMLSLFEVPAAS